MKNLTDYFQSLELMQAGVPRESADYYFSKDCQYNSKHKRQEPAFPYVPCWSIGALWEFIFSYGGKRVFVFDTSSSSAELIDAMVQAACQLARDK